jgi:hypothetical protein
MLVRGDDDEHRTEDALSGIRAIRLDRIALFNPVAELDLA